MVHLYRLIVAVLLLCFGPAALADGGPFPATPGQWNTAYCNSTNFPVGQLGAGISASWTCKATANPNVKDCGYTYNNGYYDGKCTQQKGADSCPAGANMTTGSSGESVCTCTAGLRPFNGQCVAAPSCPDGTHEEGGACVPDKCKPDEIRVNGVCVKEPDCPAGQTRVAGKCKEKQCPDPGTLAGEYRVSSTSKTSMCEGGCTVSITSFVRAVKDGKVQETIGIGYYTGGQCQGDPSTPDPDGSGGGGDQPGDGGTGPGNGGTGGTGGTGGGGNNGGGNNGGGNNGGGNNGGDNDDPDKPEKCPNGKCSGTGNDGGTNPPVPPDSTGTCPDGYYKSNGKCYRKETPPPKPPDDDGKCPQGYIKVGSTCVYLKPVPDDETDDDDDKPGLFSGSCGAFTCEGDAIQCAIAKEQHIRNCKLFDDTSPESDLYNANKGKTGNQTGDLPGNETISLTGRIDTSDPLGGGGCFGDLSVTVWGQGVSLPLSNLCQYLAMLGNILVAVSMLLAARIVTRG